MAGDTALCLSGGGYRAAIFHLGAMLRLHERDELADVELFSAVSGGSIALAWLASRYLALREGPEEDFDEWCGRCDFRAQVLEPFRAVVARDLRSRAVLATLPFNWLWPTPRVRMLESGYRRFLGRLRLGELPESPGIVFCATDISFGCNWEFSRRRVGDFQAGYLRDGTDIEVATAVAASSSFPPLFGPVRLPVGALDFDSRGAQSGSALLDRIELSDGGVYDNMAMEPAFKRYRRVMVSDAGAPFGFEAGRHYLRRLMRYAAVVGSQSISLRKRLFFSALGDGKFEGAYWHLGESRPDAEGYSQGGTCHQRLSRIRTDLDRFTAAEFEILVNHGYWSCEAGLLKGGLVDPDVESAWPYEAWREEERASHALRHSHRRFWHARWWQN